MYDKLNVCGFLFLAMPADESSRSDGFESISNSILIRLDLLCSCDI